MTDRPRSLHPAKPVAPAHVPAELVREYEIYHLSGSAKDPFKSLSALHEDRPVFYNLYADPIICPNGAWVVSSFELLSEVLQDPSRFSSREMVKYSRLIGETWDMIPLELDPPEHTRIRLVVMPMFSPGRMKALTGRIEGRAQDLIRAFRDQGECEFFEAFGMPLPVGIFLELMDLPYSRHAEFYRWGMAIINSYDPVERGTATRSIRDYLREVLDARRAHPGEDVISQILQSSAAGDEPLSDDEVIGLCFMLFIGGLDTVAATLGFTFRYLAENPTARRQMIEAPERIAMAVEEFLRAFSVVVAKRKVVADIDFHGVPMKSGDYVICVMGLGDTDPTVFGCDGLELARSPNRHVGFGMGPHRCLGSHLARLELKVALNTWLRMIPDFEVRPGAEITSHGAGGVYGYDALQLVWRRAAAEAPVRPS